MAYLGCPSIVLWRASALVSPCIPWHCVVQLLYLVQDECIRRREHMLHWCSCVVERSAEQAACTAAAGRTRRQRCRRRRVPATSARGETSRRPCCRCSCVVQLHRCSGLHSSALDMQCEVKVVSWCPMRPHRGLYGRLLLMMRSPSENMQLAITPSETAKIRQDS